MRTPFADLALLPRALLIGALSAGIAGGVAGLVVGLFAYPPTAPFAVLEVGLPAAIAGGVIGLVIGSITLALRRTDGDSRS